MVGAGLCRFIGIHRKRDNPEAKMQIGTDKSDLRRAQARPARMTTVAACVTMLAGAWLAAALPVSAQTPAPMSFQKDVMPIFEKYCVSCHSPGGVGNIAASLDLTSYRELRSGSI